MTIIIDNTTLTPYRNVVYIKVSYANGDAFIASGVIVDQNSVLTAAHVVFNGHDGAAKPSNIQVYPAYDGGFAPFGFYTPVSYDYTPVDIDGDGRLSQSESAYDVAVLHFSRAIGATGSMGLDTAFTGGTAHVTGYPGIYGGFQTDGTGSVSFGNNTLLTGQLDIHPGNSGGPIWVQEADGSYKVVGIVSTAVWAWSPHGTYTQQVLNWIRQDDNLVTGVIDDFGATAATAGHLNFANRALGTLERTGDVDWIEVSLTAGVQYQVNVYASSNLSGALRNPALDLIDAGGKTVAHDDDGGIGLDPQVTFTAATTGLYYIAVTGTGSGGPLQVEGTGNYQVELQTISTAISKPIFKLDGFGAVFPVDRGVMLINPDGTTSHYDGGIEGTVGSPSKSIDYDTWSITLQPGYDYHFKDIQGFFPFFADTVALVDHVTGDVYWTHTHQASDTDAETYSPHIRVGKATTFDLTIVNSIPFTVGKYLIELWADPDYTPVNGTNLAESMSGSSGNDWFNSLDGDDTLTGGAGADHLDGGNGLDTVVFRGTRANYALSREDGHISVADNTPNRDDIDLLFNVELLRFSDRTVYGLTGDNAEIVRLYRGALGRTPDDAGLIVQLHAHEAGLSLTSLAANFLASAEFKGRYGANPTDDQYVSALYQNVLNRGPTSAEIQFQVNEALHKGVAREVLLLGFVESAENIAKTSSLFI
jgi:V8-like Glu-specific endopeptidase